MQIYGIGFCLLMCDIVCIFCVLIVISPSSGDQIGERYGIDAVWLPQDPHASADANGGRSQAGNLRNTRFRTRKCL